MFPLKFYDQTLFEVSKRFASSNSAGHFQCHVMLPLQLGCKFD